jgi:hypothetical protein
VTSRQSLVAVASLMTPVALMAWALGLWGMAAELRWAGEFAITRGMFSHWQVWLAAGILVQFAAFLLHRFAGADEDGDDAALS